METTLDRFGRIVIPKQVREDLGLAPGSVLSIEEKGDGILLKLVAEEPPLTYKDAVLVFTGEAEGDLTTVLRGQREERIGKLAARPPE
jgi:AbrB family looped-hinge helix DNA binding protein